MPALIQQKKHLAHPENPDSARVEHRSQRAGFSLEQRRSQGQPSAQRKDPEATMMMLSRHEWRASGLGLMMIILAQRKSSALKIEHKPVTGPR
jgi:hypothetical protein